MLAEVLGKVVNCVADVKTGRAVVGDGYRNLCSINCSLDRGGVVKSSAAGDNLCKRNARINRDMAAGVDANVVSVLS